MGQWQRVALGRAFFREAPFVILDEPTAALDPRAEHDLFERIGDLLAGRTVLVISHRFSSVRHADRIVVLDQGRVVETGSHEELVQLGGLYAELFSLQAAAYLGQTASRRRRRPDDDLVSASSRPAAGRDDGSATSAGVPPVRRTSSSNVVENTACGWPAAAHTTG